MAAYIVTFCVVTAMLKAAERIKEQQRFVFEFTAIVLLCLLAGLRSINVGTDTPLYLQPCIKVAISADSYGDFLKSSWHYGWQYRVASEYEPGFLFAIFVAAKLFRSVAAAQFVIQLFIIVPVYVVIKRRKEIPLWFGMLVYMLVFFNLSLNAIRQSVAMSFTLLAVQFWSEEKKKASVLSMITAILFHLSSWVGLLMILVYSFVQKDRKKVIRVLGCRVDGRYGNMVVVILAGVLVLLSANVLVKLLQSTALARFAGYITGDVRFMPNQLIRLLPPIAIMILNYRQMEQQSKQGRFFVTMIFLSMILLQFTSVNAFGGRVAEYFMYFGIISYPAACKKGKYTSLLTTIMIGYLLFYWFFYYGFGNSGETIPYEMIGVG